MMNYEEFCKKADDINWKHRNDPESKECTKELMGLYAEYAKVQVEDPSEESDSDSAE